MEQVKRGMVWHYKAYEKEQSDADMVTYAKAEKAAREARAGLWRDAQPVPPVGLQAGHQREQKQRHGRMT